MSNATTISSFGVPGTGAGILQPQMAYQFRVRFCKEGTEELLPDTEVLTRQIMRVLPLDLKDGREAVIHIEDDVRGNVFDSLNKLNDVGDLDVHIDFLDGNEGVNRTIILQSACVNFMYMSGLNYSASNWKSKAELRANIPHNINEYVNAVIADYPQMAALLDALRGTAFSATLGEEQTGAATVHFEVGFRGLNFKLVNRKNSD